MTRLRCYFFAINSKDKIFSIFINDVRVIKNIIFNDTIRTSYKRCKSDVKKKKRVNDTKNLSL